MSDIIALKPCPFCGSTAVVLDYVQSEADCEWYTVDCRECQADGPGVCNDPAEAVRLWNTRRYRLQDMPLVEEEPEGEDTEPIL